MGRNQGMGRNLGTGRNLRAGRNLDAGRKLGNGQNRGTTWDPVNFPAGETENTFGQPFPSPDLLPRREAGALESVQREAPNLQFLQSANRKGPDWQETEGRVRKLEEQIQMQKTVVNQLSENRQGRESFPLPDTGEIARAVMKRLERELRLEKMRKGLL